MNTPRIMLAVLVALVPGLAAMVASFGVGVLWNLTILSISCLGIEVISLRLKQLSWQNIYLHIQDCSALLTAWLITICLPPNIPISSLIIASLASIGLAKHAYGGLGRNIFNPAMVGYAVLLVSFPQILAQWPAIPGEVDGLSGATLLTEFRYRIGITVEEFDVKFAVALAQQEIIALCFALGGLGLIVKQIIAWRIPVAMFGGVCICALFGYDQGSSSSAGGAIFHTLSGGFVAAAFFIATDPVTHPRRAKQQLIFGAMIGTLIYIIRSFGSFPDGIAFAVLLANCCTPLLNRVATHARLRTIDEVRDD